MTDRYNAFLVILENNLREDDAEATINAIKQIKGVLDVQPHVAGFEDAIAETRVRNRLIEQILEIVQQKGQP